MFLIIIFFHIYIFTSQKGIGANGLEKGGRCR